MATKDALGQNEIDQLIHFLDEKPEDINIEDILPKPTNILKYNWDKPKKLSQEQTRILLMIHKNFMTKLFSKLNSLLRVQITSEGSNAVKSIEEYIFNDFLLLVGNYTNYSSISISQRSEKLSKLFMKNSYKNDESDFDKKPVDLEKMSFQNELPSDYSDLFGINIDSQLSFAMLEKYLGNMKTELITTPCDYISTKEGYSINNTERQLSEVEMELFDDILKVFKDCLKESWQQYIPDINPSVVQKETKKDFINLTSPNELCIIVNIDLCINNVPGTVIICYPILNLDGILNKLTKVSVKQVGNLKSKNQELKLLLSRIPIEVKACLFKKEIPLAKAMKLKVGSLIPLGFKTETPNAVINAANKEMFDVVISFTPENTFATIKNIKIDENETIKNILEKIEEERHKRRNVE